MMATGVKLREAPGLRDLWGFYDLDRGREIKVGNAVTLLYFLFSKRTTAATVPYSTLQGPTPKMLLKITGPVADDEKPLVINYTLTRSELTVAERNGQITKRERAMFAERLAEFNNGRLPYGVYAVLGLPGKR